MSLASNVAPAAPIRWVDAHDTDNFLRRLRYGPQVRQELSAWLARIMNTWFIAGVRTARYGTPCAGVAIDQTHLERMLRKMGYVEPWVKEIAVGIAPMRATLFEAGERRAQLFSDANLAPPLTYQFTLESAPAEVRLIRGCGGP